MEQLLCGCLVLEQLFLPFYLLMSGKERKEKEKIGVWKFRIIKMPRNVNIVIFANLTIDSNVFKKYERLQFAVKGNTMIRCDEFRKDAGYFFRY